MKPKYKRGGRVKEKRGKRARMRVARLEIVPSALGRQAQPAQPKDQGLDTSALRLSPITPTRSAHLRCAAHAIGHAVRRTRRGWDTRGAGFAASTAISTAI